MKEDKQNDSRDAQNVPERPIPSQAEGDEETVDESLRQKVKKDN